MNTDGLALLERIERGNDPDLLKRIDRCAYFARSKKYYETIRYGDLLTKKISAEVATPILLARLLENLS